MEDHEVVTDAAGNVKAIAQRADMQARRTLGPTFAEGVADLTNAVSWVLYGQRQAGEDLQLVWREGNRETVWSDRQVGATPAEEEEPAEEEPKIVWPTEGPLLPDVLQGE